MPYEKGNTLDGTEGLVNQDGLIDNSVTWLETDPETGDILFSPAKEISDYIDSDGNHYVLNDDGDYELVQEAPNDD